MLYSTLAQTFPTAKGRLALRRNLNKCLIIRNQHSGGINAEANRSPENQLEPADQPVTGPVKSLNYRA